MRVIGMGSWLEQDDGAPHSIWGNGTEILWGDGEATMIAAETGAGKTTLAGQLIAGLLGVKDFDDLLGYHVTPMPKGAKLFYLAMDRPKQARRAIKRNLAGANIDKRAVVGYGPFKWPSSFPFTTTEDVEVSDRGEFLVAWCEKHAVTYLIIDSLKDLVIGLSEDKPAAEWNVVLQTVIAAGINVLILHHDRKSTRTSDGSRIAKDIADVFGSSWLVAGVGSVVHLEKTDTEDVITVRHMKSVIDPVKKFKARTDRKLGRTYRIGSTNDDALLAAIGDDWKTLTEISAGAKTKVERQKVRRDLDKMVEVRLVDKRNRAGTQHLEYHVNALRAVTDRAMNGTDSGASETASEAV